MHWFIKAWPKSSLKSALFNPKNIAEMLTSMYINILAGAQTPNLILVWGTKGMKATKTQRNVKPDTLCDFRLWKQTFLIPWDMSPFLGVRNGWIFSLCGLPAERSIGGGKCQDIIFATPYYWSQKSAVDIGINKVFERGRSTEDIKCSIL